MNLILIGIAIFPVIFLLIFIYRKDQYEREPISLLMLALFMGMLSTIPASLMEGAMSFIYMPDESRVIAYGLYNGFAVAGVCEELCKLLFLSWAVWRKPDFDEYFDGIVYAVFVSLGFAGVENLMYVLDGSSFDEALSTGVMRALLSVPAHFLFAVMMGYFFSLAKFDYTHRKSYLFKAFFIPMLMHGTFDAILFITSGLGEESEGMGFIASGLMVVFIVFDIMMWKWGLKRIKRLQERSKEQDFDRSDPFANFTWE